MQARSRNKWGLLTGSDSVGLRQIRGLNPTSPRKPFLLGRSIDLKTTTIPVPFGFISNLFPLPPRGQRRGRIMCPRRRGDPPTRVVAPVHIQKPKAPISRRCLCLWCGALLARLSSCRIRLIGQAKITRKVDRCRSRVPSVSESALGPGANGPRPKEKKEDRTMHQAK